MKHNGVYIVEFQEAVKRDEYLRQSTDVRVIGWDDDRIRVSGVDKDGEIFDDYWTPRPPEDSYKVGTGYKRH